MSTRIHTLDASAQAFVATCEAQGAPLAPRFVAYLKGHHLNSPAVEAPRHEPKYHSAMVELSRLMAQNSSRVAEPEKPTPGPLDLEPLLALDPVAHALGILINKRHGIATQLPKAHPALPEVTGRRFSTCHEIEAHWFSVLSYLKIWGSTVGLRGSKVEVFVQDGQPAVLRKGQGHPTGLTLQAIGDVQAGAIVHLDVPDGIQIGKAPDYSLQLPMADYAITPYSKISGLSFDRISPIALSDEQRQAHYGTNIGVCAMHSLAQAQTITRQALAQHLGGRP